MTEIKSFEVLSVTRLPRKLSKRLFLTKLEKDKLENNVEEARNVKDFQLVLSTHIA
jgi:hypothetical protein